ncbi:MAG: sensor histidine kinase, partial [Actinomycetota bacterium]
ARGSGVRAKIRVPKDLPPVLADPRRLREILLNLVDNAVKYTPEGGTVEISAHALDGAVAIAVADTGIGIPPGTGDRVFEPFFRAEGVRTQQGQASSGLGLAVVKRLVEAHGGRIDYESAPGAGTTFTFTVPTVDGAASATAGPGSRADV